MVVISATRAEVPLYIKSSNLSLSFIIPTYSKIASSPTKVGETLAMGIPIIANAGVGDMADLGEWGICLLLKNFSEPELQKAVNSIPDLLKLEPEFIREQIISEYDLSGAIQKYLSVYTKLDSVTTGSR